MFTVSIFGRKASPSCERRLYTSLLDATFCITVWTFTCSSLWSGGACVIRGGGLGVSLRFNDYFLCHGPPP